MSDATRQRQIQIPLPSHPARLCVNGGNLPLGRSHIERIVNQHGIDLVEPLALPVADTARPSALELYLLTNFLQLYGSARINLVVTEPPFDGAAAGTQCQQRHQGESKKHVH